MSRTTAAIKHALNKLLEFKAHVVVPHDIVPDFERFAKLLDRYDLMPRTVIDVGVAEGTPWLYRAFPEAFFILVDPTQEALPYMQRWVSQFKGGGRIEAVALGDHDGLQRILVRTDGIGASSFFEEVGPHELLRSYEVPVKRFDSIFTEFARPCLCKIDVQGAELSVVRGMGDMIFSIDAVIIETSLIRTLKGNAPEFVDIVIAMAERGFVLYDIVGMTRRPLDKALAQLDAVFVPESSPLRQDRRWRS